MSNKEFTLHYDKYKEKIIRFYKTNSANMRVSKNKIINVLSIYIYRIIFFEISKLKWIV